MRRYYLRVPVGAEGRRVEITERDRHYLTRVLRLGVGAEIDASDIGGIPCRARIAEVEPERVILEAWRVGAPVLGESAGHRVHLFQCLPKGQKMDTIVRQATEIGVTSIVPIRSARSIADPPATRMERWQRISEEALQQCGRLAPPRIFPIRPIEELTGARGDPVPGSGEGCNLFFHQDPAGSEDLLRVLHEPFADVRVLVGPEGGLSGEEVRLLREAGWRQAWLGPTVLRTETAAALAVGIVTFMLLERGLERESWSPSP